ncbi:serine-rich adhesin for platelets isoform X2 [Engraulis encrasicolus]|uniref:serine-rich adhesin for platelets isoform X2 n=1 Tax=Engraulis encrasicolus TaxID=184585 RepID=UPI002FD48DA5
MNKQKRNQVLHRGHPTGDMLTSPPELPPQIVSPVERDVKASPSTLCIPHDMESNPQIASHSTVPPSCNNGDARPEQRRSGRLQAAPKDLAGDKSKLTVRKAPPKHPKKITFASVKREGRRRGETCGDENVAVSNPLRRQAIKGQGHNMTLPSAKAQMQELESCDMAKDNDTPESPTSAAKSWAMGPLFNSFKSKMASFTEIVMSPVRLFKPTDALPSDAAGVPDGGALSFDSSGDSVLGQKAHVSRRLPIHESPTKDAAVSKLKKERVEEEWSLKSSDLTRGSLRRGKGPSQSDSDTSSVNQNKSVLLGSADPSPSNNLLVRLVSPGRPQLRHTGQRKAIPSDRAEMLNTEPSAESVEPAALPQKLKQLKSGDEQLDDRLSKLSESSVLDTPPDSFSNGDGTSEREDLEESIPVVPHTRIRSSPRKQAKGISMTPAPFAKARASARQKATGKRVVTFGKDVKEAKDVDEEEEEEKKSKRDDCQNMSTDEEVDPPETEESSPEVENARRQRIDRKRIRKPQEVDLEWGGEGPKRRLKAGKAERVPKKQGKNKEMVKKECLSEWMETSEDIVFTKTMHTLLKDSGTNPLSSSHNSSVDSDVSGADGSEAPMKFEGSSRLTRRQAMSKQSTADTVKVDPLENEYADCFTDQFAVSSLAEKSPNDGSSGGGTNENGIAASVPRKGRQRAKKTTPPLNDKSLLNNQSKLNDNSALTNKTPLNDSSLLTSKTKLNDNSLLTNKTNLKSSHDGSVFSPNLEESSASLLNSTALSQSMLKSGRKRRLMKTPSQMFGDELPDDDTPSASFFKLDNTISEMREKKSVRGDEKKRQENAEEPRRDGSADEAQKTPSKRQSPRALKRKSPSPSTERSLVDGPETAEEEDCGALADAEEPPEASASGSGSNRLLRSFSCPEIATLSHHEQPWRSPNALLPSHDRPLRSSAPYHHHHHHRTTPHQPPPHLSPSKRARRHTVCSLEIAREIAPLCLRKEVYPTRRGGLYGSPSHPLCPNPASPSTSFTALVSSFLSSPLAFLSRRSDRAKRKARADDGLSSSSSSTSSSFYSTSSSFSPSVSLSASSSLSPPSTSSSAVHHSPAGFTCIAPPTSSHFSDSVSPADSSTSQDEDSGQQSEDGDESSCLNVEMLSTGIPEEKALSDSEIKMETRHGKVSSIRIRKTLPKPLHHLTPMGLPKLIRPKKKEFSVEEIYTNKNFTKPGEGRLETIFEVPLNRRDGSHCLLGQKRVKRFVEFAELGKVRKARKPLVGLGNSNNATTQKKTGAQTSAGRPRRGAWSTSKDEQNELQLSPEDLDSLLCSKLDELDSLIADDQCSS